MLASICSEKFRKHDHTPHSTMKTCSWTCCTAAMLGAHCFPIAQSICLNWQRSGDAMLSTYERRTWVTSGGKRHIIPMARRRYRKVTSGSGKSHQGRRITMAQQQVSSSKQQARRSSSKQQARRSSSKQQQKQASSRQAAARSSNSRQAACKQQVSSRRAAGEQQESSRWAAAGKHQASTRQAARILEGRRNIMLASICWEKIIKHVHTPCCFPCVSPRSGDPNATSRGENRFLPTGARWAAGEQQQVSSSRSAASSRWAAAAGKLQASCRQAAGKLRASC